MPIKFLLFDLDNTILDFSHASKLALNHAFDQLQIEHTPENLEAYAQVNHQVWTDYEEGRLSIDKLPGHRARLFMKKVHNSTRKASLFNDTYLDKLSNENHYLPAVEPTLEHLKEEGYAMYIVTNGLSRVQRNRWKVTNLSDHFQDIFIAEEVGKPKPHAYYFDYVHGQIGRPNRQEVMIVGDNPVSDIHGGKNYGYRTCWYDRGKIDPETVPAHDVITQMDQLLDLLPSP